MNFAPYKINEYFLDLRGHRCEVATIAAESPELCVPLWNLFWLSNPALDKVPGAGANWWRSYSPVRGLLKAIIHDVADDSTLEHALTQHPEAFLDWWGDQRHDVFATHEILGDSWIDIVTSRAQAASDRMLDSAPTVTAVGNVLVLSDFRQARGR